jgi:transcriptional regulator with XRE-family HTH domain
MVRERGSGITPPRVVDLLRKAVEEKSQLAVSRGSGLGIAAINRYLSGIGEPTTGTLKKLSDYFEVPVGWLRGHAGYWKDETFEEYCKATGNNFEESDFDKKEIRFWVYGKDYEDFIEAVNELRSMDEGYRRDAVALLKKLNAKSKTAGLDDDIHDYPPIK